MHVQSRIFKQNRELHGLNSSRSVDILQQMLYQNQAANMEITLFPTRKVH